MGRKLVVRASQSNTKTHVINTLKLYWTVDGFVTLAPGVGKSVISDTFQSEIETVKDTWTIVLYPDGFNRRVEGYISVWLKRTTHTERFVRFTCAIIDEYGKEYHKKSIKQKLSLESVLGWATFCKRTSAAQHLLKSGNLYLIFTLNIYSEKEMGRPLVEYDGDDMIERSKEVCKNLSELLIDGKFSDFTIEFRLGSDEFRVHRNILSARSEVFRAMLNSPLQKNVHTIIIEDISPEAMKEMLRFIYGGELGNFDLEIASNLYYAADKYALDSLKKLCSKILARNMSQENIVHIFLLADRHVDLELRDLSVHFIADNFLEIKDRSDWLEMMKTHPNLANRVVESLAELLIMGRGYSNTTYQSLVNTYANQTSTHGVRNIISSRHLGRKLFWALVFLTSFGACCYHCSYLIMIFASHPKATITEEKDAEDVEFPSLTLCNLNIIKKVDFPLSTHCPI